MNGVIKTWAELKQLKENKLLSLQYVESDVYYNIFINDGCIVYFTELWKDTSKVKGIDVTQNNLDLADFNTNYKSDCNTSIAPISADGKNIVRAESRPLDCTTMFTCSGDSSSQIGDGKVMKWDFSNDIDDLEMPSGFSGKRKRIEISFLDGIYLKEGTIYYHDAPKGAYISLYIVCPSGQYYYDNDGNLQQATEDTIITCFVCNHQMIGTVAMGDELNTETCSDKIPSTYKFWVEITVPSTDSSSHGYVSMELYRTRTIVL